MWQAYLAKNKSREEVNETESGLQFEILHRSDSEQRPTEADKVTVHYHGTLIDGSVFDSSVDRGQPIDFFLTQTLGNSVRDYYQIIIGEPGKVANVILKGIRNVRKYRKAKDDAYYYNWLLKIPDDLQEPFAPSHENLAALDLTMDQPAAALAANLRRAFSGIAF